MAIIVRQIPDDTKVSPIGLGDFIDWEELNVYRSDLGGFEYTTAEVDKIDKIMSNYNWLCDELPDDDTAMDVFDELNPSAEYPPMEIMKETIRSYFNGGSDMVEAVRCMLEYMTGKDYITKDIHGCVQGETATVLYRKEYYYDKAIRDFEVEYFNLGTEWRVVDEDGSSMYIYTHDFDINEQKKEIAGILGENLSDIILEVFTGYVQIPKYERR